MIQSGAVMDLDQFNPMDPASGPNGDPSANLLNPEEDSPNDLPMPEV